MNIIKPKLTAIIKTSGIKSPVQWIDLEERICRTKAGYEGPIDNFVFVDERDYDSLRGEFAGRAMQAQLSGMTVNNILMEQAMKQTIKEGKRNLAEWMAEVAVGYADALIAELKKEHELEYYLKH